MGTAKEKILFVTGKLAESAVREVVDALQAEIGFEAHYAIMPITVAALMTPEWLAKKLVIPSGMDRVILPGYCGRAGDVSPIQRLTDARVEVGPKDCRQLPEFFGQQSPLADYGNFDIEIIAEINHAMNFTADQVLEMAKALCQQGANIIDIGCDPTGTYWAGVGDCVRHLVDHGIRTSVDSLNPREIQLAVDAGASLVLSVNGSNVDAAADWGVPVVAIPDDPQQLCSLAPTVNKLQKHSVPFRLDPILEPIGLGFGRSIQRYFECRRRWPDADMMMGVGNLSEMTDVDSAGINVLLLALCQELQIRSVLTTQVINWARTAVPELHRARKLVHYANRQGVPAKHLDSELVMLRDPKLMEVDPVLLDQLAEQIRDHDLRIFADGHDIHLVGSQIHLHHSDPFAIFDKLESQDWKNLSPGHAFYLGYEMCKAMIANTLGKQYTQDEALNWGMLTQHEQDRHRVSRRTQNSSKAKTD